MHNVPWQMDLAFMALDYPWISVPLILAVVGGALYLLYRIVRAVIRGWSR